MSLVDDLAEVEAAISAVLKSQAYSYEGQQVTRASLKELRAYRTALKTLAWLVQNVAVRSTPPKRKK